MFQIIFFFSILQCGPNAECRHEVFRGEGAGSETICVCKEGYSGDPDSQRGCNEHTTSPGTNFTGIGAAS